MTRTDQAPKYPRQAAHDRHDTRHPQTGFGPKGASHKLAELAKDAQEVEEVGVPIGQPFDDKIARKAL